MNDIPDDHRRLFERLCLLRALYERRGPRDGVSVISISEAIRAAETMLVNPAEAWSTIAR